MNSRFFQRPELWLGYVTPALVLVLWEALSALGALDRLIFPPPSRLASAAAALVASGELPAHLRSSLTRTLAGFLLGAIPGLAAGLAMGSSRWLSAAFEPLFSALYTMPKLTLLPMMMLLVGLGETPRLLLIALSCFLITWTNSLDAVRNLDRGYLELARNYGAGPATLFFRIRFPAILPQAFTGVRLALGRALTLTISIELLGSPSGIGSLIWTSWQTLRTEDLYVAVILMACLGVLLNVALKKAEALVIPWKVTHER